MFWVWTIRTLEKDCLQRKKSSPPKGNAQDAIKAIMVLDYKSKYHADGRPLNRTGGSLQPHPKKEQFPVSSGKTPGVQDLISWS
jgi:hypothetical protein